MGWSWNDVSVDAGAPSANLVDTPMVSAYLFAAQRTQHVISGEQREEIGERP